MLDAGILFIHILAFSESFLKTSAWHTLLIVTHIMFILYNQFIINTSWDSPPAVMSDSDVEFYVVQGWSWSRFHWVSALRFILEGCVVPRVLIHLLSSILQKHRSWLHVYSWPIARTVTPVNVCPSPLKYSATGDSPVLLCAKLKRWLLALQYVAVAKSCPHIIGHMYCRLLSKQYWRFSSLERILWADQIYIAHMLHLAAIFILLYLLYICVLDVY